MTEGWRFLCLLLALALFATAGVVQPLGAVFNTRRAGEPWRLTLIALGLAFFTAPGVWDTWEAWQRG